MTTLPRGFHAHVASIGIKDSTDDFLVLASDQPCSAAAVFTRSRFAGPSVDLSRSNVANGQLQAFTVLSKNANVATGEPGLADAHEIVAAVADAVGTSNDNVLIASTGVIGRRYPMEKIRDHLTTLRFPFDGTDAESAAQAIMTTDTVPKIASSTVTTVTGSSASIVGIAKGVGMIEPDMATLITLFCTDADVASADLDVLFRRVMAVTFNALSIDTDTSTSDTAAIMANGASGAVPLVEFETALLEVAQSLTRQIARDGEGATTLIEVLVDQARDVDQAKRVAKSVVNSPLVKTAVHGADPNWGRVAMAIGKCSEDLDIDQSQVIIRFGSTEVYPVQLDQQGLDQLSIYLTGDEVLIHISLAVGSESFTAYGCDLSDGYVRINADYTT